MTLEELKAYASKYGLAETRKWTGNYPGVTVLFYPLTDEWIAVLSRQWNDRTGETEEKLDIRCGISGEDGDSKTAAYICPPFLMRRRGWTGVRLDGTEDRDTVCGLLDRAVQKMEAKGTPIVLTHPGSAEVRVPPAPAESPHTAQTPPGSGFSLVPEAARDPRFDNSVPEQIRAMLRAYDFSCPGHVGRWQNFCAQGRLMRDYTDDNPYVHLIDRQVPTYHDLNIRQLRGYFTWRTQVRSGQFPGTCRAYVFLYFFELLNQITADTPEEALEKMRQCLEGYREGLSRSEQVPSELRRWMMEFCVIHGFPVEMARSFADAEACRTDERMEVLRHPDDAADDAVFQALFASLSSPRTNKDVLLRKRPEEARRLYALLWRTACRKYDAFTSFFGELKEYPWYPLSGALYEEKREMQPAEYSLNPCRTYVYRDGGWWQRIIGDPKMNRKQFDSFLLAANGAFRKYLHVPGSMGNHPISDWMDAVIREVIEADRQALEEAKKPKVVLDLTRLAGIRRDAEVTRDSLLTEEETEKPPAVIHEPAVQEKPPAPVPEPDRPDRPHMGETVTLAEPFPEILRALLEGGSVRTMLRDRQLMPALAAETLNEAFFEAVGDVIVEEADGELLLVTDYTEDVRRLLGPA